MISPPFRAAQCQANSPVKTLEQLDCRRNGEVIEVRASARSFLHNQVRSLVGSLKLVGEGRWSKDDLAAALEARDHAACGALAPAYGLYLVKVDYDLSRLSVLRRNCRQSQQFKHGDRYQDFHDEKRAEDGGCLQG